MQADTRQAFRWSGAFAIVLALHIVAGWLLANHLVPPMLLPAVPEAVMLDLAPELPAAEPASVPPPQAVPPPPVPRPLAPPPPPQPPVLQSPAPELLLPDLPPTPPVAAEVVLPIPVPPPPTPKPRPRPVKRRLERPIERPAERQPTPSVAEETPRPIQAPPPPAAAARPPAPPSNATPSWRSELLARLQRAKRYPDYARSHGDQGVATVTFTMDRAGRVLNVALANSSGHTSLDEEAVALVHRAAPLPLMPDEMQGETITLTLPVSFALR